ncbi:serine/threonine protein kinase [Candidatus Saganbacteria bacterium]|nr:serine/threonine protein kinase [Candidatus Saganbacteria bacterium]
MPGGAQATRVRFADTHPTAARVGRKVARIGAPLAAGAVSAISFLALSSAAAPLAGLVVLTAAGLLAGEFVIARPIANHFRLKRFDPGKLAKLEAGKSDAERRLRDLSFDGGNNVLIGSLGGGGMAYVLKVFNRGTEKMRVYKLPRPEVLINPEYLARFNREMAAMRTLEDPSIVRIEDVINVDHETYCRLTHQDIAAYLKSLPAEQRKQLVVPLSIPGIIMEYVDSPTLRQYFQMGINCWDNAERLRVGIAIGQAIKGVHRKGIIHRDLKPENMFGIPDPTNRSLLHPINPIKLFDFGITKRIGDQGLTQDGTAMGTPEYMSPEQAKGSDSLDKRSDVYSWGVMLWELLAGEPVFGICEDGKTPAYLVKILTKPIPKVEALGFGKGDPDLVKLMQWFFDKILAKDPNHRFSTIDEALPYLEEMYSRS